jgi:hypothetical protein
VANKAKEVVDANVLLKTFEVGKDLALKGLSAAEGALTAANVTLAVTQRTVQAGLTVVCPQKIEKRSKCFCC